MMKRFKMFVTFSILFVLVACGSQGPTGPQGTKQKTQILSEAAGKQLREIAADGTMIFDVPDISPQATYTDGQLNDMSKAKKGDILVSGPTSSAPYGFLNKITNVTTSKGKVRVQTEKATLEEAIEHSDMGAGSYTLNSGELELRDATVVYDPQVIDVSGETWDSPASLYELPMQLDPQFRRGVSEDYCFSNKTVKDGSKTLATISGCITPSAFAELQMDIGVTWKFIVPVPRVDRFMTKVGGGVNGNLKVETANAQVGFNESITLASYVFGASTFFVGPIPVVLTPRLNIVLNIDGSISYEASIDARGNVDFELGGEYKRDSGWRAIKSFDYDFNIDGAGGGAYARLRSSIAGAEVGVYLYDTIGPVVGIDPHASAQTKISGFGNGGQPIITGSLHAGVDAYVKIDSKRFFKFLEREWRYTLLNKQVGSF